MIRNYMQQLLKKKNLASHDKFSLLLCSPVNVIILSTFMYIALCIVPDYFVLYSIIALCYFVNIFELCTICTT